MSGRAFALLILTLAFGLCAPAAQAEPTSVWRMHTEHLADDRALVHNCLSVGNGMCDRVVQEACVAGFSEDARGPALDRQCDWRAIAAWEDEMNAILATLRGRLSGRDLANLNASQEAWNTSMLADVGLGMDFFEGGSLAGPVGAHIRAQETAQRATYLDSVQMMTDDQ